MKMHPIFLKISTRGFAPPPPGGFAPTPGANLHEDVRMKHSSARANVIVKPSRAELSKGELRC